MRNALPLRKHKVIYKCWMHERISCTYIFHCFLWLFAAHLFYPVCLQYFYIEYKVSHVWSIAFFAFVLITFLFIQNNDINRNHWKKNIGMNAGYRSWFPNEYQNTSNERMKKMFSITPKKWIIFQLKKYNDDKKK